MKITLFVVIGMIALSITACSGGNEEISPTIAATKAKFRNREKKMFHGDMKTIDSAVSASPVLLSLKNNHLDVSSTKTIGEAFDSYRYAIKKEWRETPTKGGPYYIDYICWFNVGPVSSAALIEGVVKRGLNIKFAVQENGETYIAMASRIVIKSDGMLYSTPCDPPEIRTNVTAIYENREITF